MANDLIAAIATAYGKAGIAVIRMSGPGAEKTLEKLFKPQKTGAFPLQSHLLTYGHLVENLHPTGKSEGSGISPLMDSSRSTFFSSEGMEAISPRV